jgi:uncharacterized repeat protein (TIGR03803 family)
MKDDCLLREDDLKLCSRFHGLQAERPIVCGMKSILVVLVLCALSFGQQEKVLYSFNPNGTDGAEPEGGLIRDAAGNLYGATRQGGIYHCAMYASPSIHCGTVFELTPVKGGCWTEKVLHSFGSGNDGIGPKTLIFDNSGNLYGVTSHGGAVKTDRLPACHFGCGTVFELIPTRAGGWTEKVLHSFGKGQDGVLPAGPLTLDVAGNLYGTTCIGGAYDNGTVFELSPAKNGEWTEKVLHSFNRSGGSAQKTCPNGGLIFDSAGNLYGTTMQGGEGDCYGATGDACGGTAFELTPTKVGEWTEKVLHSFGEGKDGANPGGGLIRDVAGNLYGTTTYGGAYHCAPETPSPCTYGYGTVFQLTPTKNGQWTEKVLYGFGKCDISEESPANLGRAGPNAPKCIGEVHPSSSLVVDAAGNLYGTTDRAVFELSPTKNGAWREIVLGAGGPSALIIDAAGNIYGTTPGGGAYGEGTVFELAPKTGDGRSKKLHE